MHTSLNGSRALDRVLPLTDRVSGLVGSSSHAVVRGDANAARRIVATGGEWDQAAAELRAAWDDVLATGDRFLPDKASAVGLLVSLDKLVELAGTICRQLIDLSDD